MQYIYFLYNVLYIEHNLSLDNNRILNEVICEIQGYVYNNDYSEYIFNHTVIHSFRKYRIINNF